MKIGIPKEIHLGEKRVATTPDAATQIMKLGFAVCIESGAGLNADISDAAYQAVGVEVLLDAPTLWREADIIMKVRAPEQHPELGIHEVDLLPDGGRLISFIWPAQ